MTRMVLTGLSMAIIVVCVMFRHHLESNPVSHVLVLLPALAIAGALFAFAMRSGGWVMKEGWANAVVLLSVSAIFFWMLPRYIDQSLVEDYVSIAKFISIPALVGFPIALAWRWSHPFLRGFLKANALSMLGVLGYLYTHSPVRICNSYLVADQEQLGYGFLIVAIVLAVAWSVPLFFPVDGRQTSQTIMPRGYFRDL